MHSSRWLTLAILTFIVSCQAGCMATSTTNHNPSTAGPVLGTFGIDTAQMDPGSIPGDDFYRYVNGKWLDETTIPDDQSRYGSFVILRDKSEADVHVLLEDLVATPPTDPTLRKVADFYATWMDEATIEQRGIAPLLPDLMRIDAAQNRNDLMQLILLKNSVLRKAYVFLRKADLVVV